MLGHAIMIDKFLYKARGNLPHPVGSENNFRGIFKTCTLHKFTERELPFYQQKLFCIKINNW